MQITVKIFLFLIVFLAISSGITKVMLMPQEVEFFRAYGFSSLLIVLFGTSQILGGLLLLFVKLRIIGALLVGITFLISLVLLVLDENILFAILTVIALSILGLIVKTTQKTIPS